MKIGFATVDWSESFFQTKYPNRPIMGGSGWARLGQYVDLIPHNVVIGTLAEQNRIFGVRDWDGKFHFDVDILVMQRCMHDGVAETMPHARAAGQIIVNEVDDWYWGLSQTNMAWRNTHPKFNPKENRAHYKKTLQHSTVVTASTPYLAHLISTLVTTPVEVITNYIEIDKFNQFTHTESEQPVVGWVGSTAHRSNDIEILRPVYRTLTHQGKIKVHHSGHYSQYPPFYRMAGLNEDQVTTYPMDGPEHYQNLLNFDIGVVPLNDIPFNKAKSYIKGLEYAAAGIPFIASPLDEYVTLHEKYGIGRIADKPKHWIAAINELRDPEVRTKEAARHRELLAPFDVTAGAANLTRFLESLV